MYIELERRKELKERYKDHFPMQNLDVNDEDRMDDWEDWDIIAIVDDMPGHGQPVSEKDKQAIMVFEPHPHKPYAEFTEKEWMEAWDSWHEDLIQQERDKIVLKAFAKAYPAKDGMSLDDSMRTQIIADADKDSRLIEKDRKDFIGKKETIEAYKKIKEKFSDEPYIVAYIERCIENGGGDPTKMEEDLSDPAFREFIKEQLEIDN